MDISEGPNAVTVSGIVLGLASGGIVNTSVLIWLGVQYMKISTRLAIMETHIGYLRREVAYVNGRDEPDDNEDRERRR